MQKKIKKVIFVSSTSVYENKNRTISESDGEESKLSPLITIENLFKNSIKKCCIWWKFV